MQRVRASIPATSANLGPGFDSLGLALGLYNTVEIHKTDSEGFTVEIQGEGAEALPTNDDNGVIRAANMVFDRVGERPRGLHYLTINHIPLGSGLGGSAAAWVGGLVAANALLGGPLSQNELLQMAVDLEGHPDNVAPAMLGGLTVSSHVDAILVARRVAIPPMKVVIVLPAMSLSTAEQRAALPRLVPLQDAAANIGRAALVVQALVEGDLNLLGDVMHDRLHEPTRGKAITGFDEAVSAAYEAGAAAVAISGAGPALIAFAGTGHEKIGRAMAEAFRRVMGKEARRWVLPVDTTGAQVFDLSEV